MGCGASKDHSKTVQDTAAAPGALVDRATERAAALKNIVFVTGYGETTELCTKLAKEFRYTHISVDGLLKAEIDKATERGISLKEGIIENLEGLIVTLVKEVMDQSESTSGFIIEDFPTLLSQARLFESAVGIPRFLLFIDNVDSVLHQKKSGVHVVDMLHLLPTVAHYAKIGKCAKISGSYEEARKVFAPDAVLKIQHSNLIFVLGGPGSGKGTQCARLAAEKNFAHLSTGDLLRAELDKGSDIGKQCGELMKEGKIVPMDIVIGLLRNAIVANIDSPGILIDGFPRAVDQALLFEKTIAKPNKVLFFHCPLEILEQRLLERGKTSGRADDNIETIRKRFETFEQQSLPVVTHYSSAVVKIDSSEPVDAVYEKVKKAFEPTAPPPAAEQAAVASTGAEISPQVPVIQTEVAAPVDPWKNIVFVLGGPGCGTQCVRLAKEFNLTHLSAGDLLRAEVASGSARAQELDALMKEGKIVPMEVTVKLIQEAMTASSGSSGFLIDGFPRALDQAKTFESMVAPCRLALFFDCPEEELEARLLERGKTSGRADDNIDTIKKRFKTFIDTSFPVIEYFRRVGKCITVSSIPHPDVVYADARQYFVDPKPLDVPIEHSNLIFVLGGPGSGTQCARLKVEFNFAHLSTGDLLRAEVEKGSKIGATCADLMKEGKIVPQEIVLGLLRQAIAENIDAPGILIDGFPRAVDQAVAFEKSIAKPSKVLFFNCPLQTLEERLIERGKTSGRADDNIETIRKRFRTFEEQSLPVVVQYLEKLHRIESVGAIDDVYAKTRAIFIPPTPIEHNNIIFVLGGPGSGKGTQCARLAHERGYAHLSTGDLLRAELDKGSDIGKRCGELMKEGKIVPMDIVIGLLRSAILENISASGILIDGFPRAVDQAILFENTVAKPNKVLFFHCPLEILEQRLLERGKTSGRADDNIDTIRKRFETFEQQSLPVVTHYGDAVIKVDSIATVDEVYAQVIEKFPAA